ncbi:inositol monophosphatase family protein [Ekhidna sp.]|uniref:inositol monophosphatase family protein n=1 Tax=Ekhidna sp. TaxID=2608089 RepID=UPI003CCBB9F8
MKLKFNELSHLSETAAAAALEAGQYILSRFKTQFEKRPKDGGDTLASQVVTEVDITAQNIILKHLKPSINKYDLGLLTEELDDNGSRLSKDYFWCIDPMDGTLPFSEGKTGYAVSIALISRDGNPVIGVVNIPDLQECYVSIKHDGVKLNGEVFASRNESHEGPIHMYMDRSFNQEPYFNQVMNKMEGYASEMNVGLVYTDHFGGVRNAISVMNVSNGCYFKFPKQNKGCGSIWDYAATRLFFEELDLPVFNAFGEVLFLNDAKTAFMNKQGITYSTRKELSQYIFKLKKDLFNDNFNSHT